MWSCARARVCVCVCVCVCSTEKEINEVCELLAQLHQMVEANGEQMDRIEAWVAQDLHQVKVSGGTPAPYQHHGRTQEVAQ
jgi:hypothetical protein